MLGVWAGDARGEREAHLIPRSEKFLAIVAYMCVLLRQTVPRRNAKPIFPICVICEICGLKVFSSRWSVMLEGNDFGNPGGIENSA
jgi:hypothetical protein